MMKKTEIALLLVLLATTFSIGYLSSDYLQGKTTQLATLSLLPEKNLSATIDIVAVQAQGQAGVINTATVEIQLGQGRVLFALNPFIEPDTQQSAETAKNVAETITGKSLAGKDVIYSIDAGNIQLVGGPSAGAALAIATIAAIEQKEINQNVEITGTILPDGSIGQIGGVIEKLAACAENGKTVFLVPKGQSIVNYYEQQITREQRGNFIIERTTYVPKTLNLNDYAKEQNWNIEIKEVANIQEAMQQILV